jgi:hypothetical protein
MDLPIVCTLSTQELQIRRQTVLQSVAEEVLETNELPGGVSYRFPSDAFSKVAELIDLERACCQFLKFRLTIEPGNGPLVLEITGPPGAKEFLSSLFGPEGR